MDVIEKLPSLFTNVVIFDETLSINKVTVLPASAVPSIVGALLLVIFVTVVIIGCVGAIVSILIDNWFDSSEILPSESVDVTVNTYVLSESSVSVIEKLPPKSATEVNSDTMPLINKVTVLFGAAVPTIVGVVIFVSLIEVVIAGIDVSTVIDIEFEIDEIFPAESVAVTVNK